MGYPAAVGLPELREAVAGWVGAPLRRRARPRAARDPDARLEGGDLLVRPRRARPRRRPGHRRPDGAGLSRRRARGAVRRRAGRRAAAARGERLPPRPRRGPGRDVAADGARLGQLPEQPDRRRRRRSRSTSGWRRSRREHDFVLASDEAYTELWFDEPPVSALQLGDWTNLAVFNTLSKRSSMTGYRSGFVAGDPELIAALKQFRPNVGTAPQEFVQRASVVAWGDEEHVERARAVVRRASGRCSSTCSRASACAMRAARRRCTSGSRRPHGETSEAFATRLLEHGVHRRAGVVPRRLGRGLRPLRARPDRGRVRAGGRDPRAGALTPPGAAEPGSARISVDGARAADRRDVGVGRARPGSASRRRSRCSTPARSASPSPRRRLGRQRVGEEGDPALLPHPQGRADGHRRPPLPRQDPRQVRLRRPRRSRRAARGRALRLVPLRRLRADARLRQHRRLGRAADDGRHVGHRRLVRADRRRRAPRGRASGSAACSSRRRPLP